MITKHKEQYIRTKQKYPKDLEKISNVHSFKADHALLLLAHCPTHCFTDTKKYYSANRIHSVRYIPFGYIRIHTVPLRNCMYEELPHVQPPTCTWENMDFLVLQISAFPFVEVTCQSLLSMCGCIHLNISEYVIRRLA